MTTSLFTQKNICAALGFIMAITIVLKANQEAKLAKQTARFEYAKPTTTIGERSHSSIIEFTEFQNEKPQVSELFPKLGV
ncbi:hypothetical protein [Algoriphagus marinus]|jgi:hypothetical protein|uniref:hypothetical protein n=1 Tax=Algoriphagus marinus TaxID=1925762 RepID=UPI00094B8D91|nr:hypothetical protein [Algoriphagus marinus]